MRRKWVIDINVITVGGEADSVCTYMYTVCCMYAACTTGGHYILLFQLPNHAYRKNVCDNVYEYAYKRTDTGII